MHCKEDILKYYAGEEFKPELPEYFNHRHYRFRIHDGTWRSVKRHVKSLDELRANIIKLGGLDLYYSTSQWLNPKRVSAKGGSGTYFVADNLLLGNDLVFDIDADSPWGLKELDKARKSANNIYEGMKFFPEYEFRYFAFTGMKGFRLVYKKDGELPPEPRKRFDMLLQNRKLFIDSLLKICKEKAPLAKFYSGDVFFDKEITLNPMCVIRLIGSIHSKTGFVSCKLPVSMLRKPVKQILTHVPYIGKNRPGILGNKEMTQGEESNLFTSSLKQKGPDVTGLASPHSSIKYFISNRVLGIKNNFVPIFAYQRAQPWYKDIKRIQAKFKLGKVYVFKNEKNVYAISLKAMQRRQLQKVLNYSMSRSKHSFRKFKRIFMPFNLNYDCVIDDKFTGHLSIGHWKYVNPKKEPPRGQTCGWDKIEFVKATKE